MLVVGSDRRYCRKLEERKPRPVRSGPVRPVRRLNSPGAVKSVLTLRVVHMQMQCSSNNHYSAVQYRQKMKIILYLDTLLACCICSVLFIFAIYTVLYKCTVYFDLRNYTILK